MSRYNTARVAILALLGFCGASAAQDRIIVTDRPAVTIAGKKSATSMPTEMATYLGIATSPASAAIREQLKLPRGIGVVVERAVKKPLATYLSEKLWKPWGMERDAFWMVDQGGHEGDSATIT